MKTERPPELWEADTVDSQFFPLLGEMIAAALSTGIPIGELTLNASNVVVEPPEDGEDAGEPAPAEYVAITVSGATDYGPDDSWPATGRERTGLLHRLHDRLVSAGATFAYIRRIPPQGSFTVFFRRDVPRADTLADQA
ncbi:MAG: hypothetical protein ACREOG_21370 [Gemmatimonadaceae bacterium]